MRAAVVGGGWAGLAAALALGRGGHRVCLFESAPQLGGRARSVRIGGHLLDNGQHLLLGAYRDTLGLIESLHPAGAVPLCEIPLTWLGQGRRLQVPITAGRVGLLAALLWAKGFSPADKLQMLRYLAGLQLGRRPQDDVTVVADLLGNGQGSAVCEGFWHPLCLAALNTPPAKASATLFANVLADGVLGGGHAARMLIPHLGMSDLFATPVGEEIIRRGGEVRLGCTVRSLRRDGAGVTIGSEHFDACIVALPWWRLKSIARGEPSLAQAVELAGALEAQPIYTVWLQYAQATLPAPIVAGSGIAQWLFDHGQASGKPGLISVVISGEGSHEALSRDELAAATVSQVGEFVGGVPPLWVRVIAEKRATWSAVAGVRRPGPGRPPLLLAGDWLDGPYPATLEAAVRSGLNAAELLQHG